MFAFLVLYHYLSSLTSQLNLVTSSHLWQVSTVRMRLPRNKKDQFRQGPPKFSTIDATYKLVGSLPPPREGCSVTTMDKFVSMELQGKIIKEHHDIAATTRRSQSLSFFLDLIFATFNKDFTDLTPESLTVPLSTIPKVVHPSLSYQWYNNLNESKPIELYNKEKKHWRWNLPLTEPTTEEPDSAGTPGNSSNITGDREPLSSEKQVALFLNLITDTFAANQACADKSFTKEPCHQWLANWSKLPMPGSTGYSHKPDLILIDNSPLSQDKITWLSPKVIAEYMKEKFQPASRVGKTIDTKAYLVLVDQPWRRFILGLTIANSKLHVHFYDHSGGAISPPFNIHDDAQHFVFIIAAIAFGC